MPKPYRLAMGCGLTPLAQRQSGTCNLGEARPQILRAGYAQALPSGRAVTDS